MERLIFVSKVGENSDKNFEYDFYFYDGNLTVNDILYLDSWKCEFAAQNEMEAPLLNGVNIKRLKTNIPFICAQKNSCYSMIYAVNNIIALCYEDISEYDEYPEPIRLVFQFNETYDDIVKKLSQRKEKFV